MILVAFATDGDSEMRGGCGFEDLRLDELNLQVHSIHIIKLFNLQIGLVDNSSHLRMGNIPQKSLDIISID